MNLNQSSFTSGPPSEQSAPVRVVLADDHLVVRHGLRALLQAPGAKDIKIVGEAETGEEAVKICCQLQPDLVLLDWRMPFSHGQKPSDGIETTRLINQGASKTRVVVLTSYDGSEHITSALRAGVFSYLMKDISATELLRAIRLTARGEPVLHPQVARVLMQSVSVRNARPDLPSHEKPAWELLSPREMDVLRALSEGLSNSEMAMRFVLSEKTVKAHVSKILAKLDVSDRTQAAVYAWRHGIASGK